METHVEITLTILFHLSSITKTLMQTHNKSNPVELVTVLIRGL